MTHYDFTKYVTKERVTKSNGCVKPKIFYKLVSPDLTAVMLHFDEKLKEEVKCDDLPQQSGTRE